MFAKLTQHRTFVFCAVAALAVGLIAAGCNLFESKSSPTLPQADAPQANYIVGGAEDDGWTAYYTPGDTYFKLTIPVVGVVKIHYTVIQGVQTGSTFTLVLKTTAPTTHEIGLKTFEVDGKPVTDVVECAWVEYVENGEFASMPTNAVLEETGKQYVQYERETGDSETEEWWPVDQAEEFVFSTDATHLIRTMKPYCQQQLLVDEGKPASRPAPVATAASWCKPPATLYGFKWYYVTGGQSCNSACQACGSTVNTAGLNYFVGNANAATECAALIPAVVGGSASGAINDNPPSTTYGLGGANGCHDYTNDPPAGIIWVNTAIPQNASWVINAGEGMFCPCK